MAENSRRRGQTRLFLDSVFRDNPVFTMALGICASLAVSNNARTALIMGICVSIVMLVSGVVLSALKRVISASVRIPCAVLLVATAIALLEYILKAYIPAAWQALALYLPLVSVNCLVLGRAESFAFRNSIARTAVSSLGVGLGYTVSMTLVGVVRELLGSGTIFGHIVTQGKIPQMGIFAMAPGGLFVFGCFAAAVKKLGSLSQPVQEEKEESLGEYYVYTGTPQEAPAALPEAEGRAEQ